MPSRTPRNQQSDDEDGEPGSARGAQGEPASSRNRRGARRGDDPKEPFQMRSLEGAYVLPLVEHAMWSTNFEVKRDAVAGLASLAKTEENKEIMGRMGALVSLVELVFVPSEPEEAEGFGPGGGRPITPDQRGGVPGGRMGMSGPGDGRPASRGGPGGGRGGGGRTDGAATQPVLWDTKLQKLSAQVLADLVSIEYNQKAYVGLGGLEKTYLLVQTTTSPSIRRVMARVMYNLSNNETIQKKMVETGALGPLFYLSPIPDDKIRRYAFGALRRLSTNKHNQEVWGEDNIVTMLRYLEDTSLDMRMQMCCLDTLMHLSECHQNRITLVNYAGSTMLLAKFLDLEQYDDDVHMLAAKVIGRLATSADARKLLGVKEVLQPFHTSIEHCLLVQDKENLRVDLEALAVISDSKENHPKVVEMAFLDLMFKATSMDKAIKRLALRIVRTCSNVTGDVALWYKPYMPKIIGFMVRSSDFGVQCEALEMLSHLSEEEALVETCVPYTEELMAQLEQWGTLPDEKLNRLSSHLAANMVSTHECRIRLVKNETIMRTFMDLTKSRDPQSQAESTRFLVNMAKAGESVCTTLVDLGVVWRLKNVESSKNASAFAKLHAKECLQVHLKEHVSAILIQSIIRGRIQRREARKKMDRLRAERDAMLAAEAEAKKGA